MGQIGVRVVFDVGPLHTPNMRRHMSVIVVLALLAGSAAIASSAANAAATGTGSIDVGKTILLGKPTRNTNCVLGPNPDRRCSPGAYYSKLTKAVICAPGFRPSQVGNVPKREQYVVEFAYGLEPGHPKISVEIDHIVPLELGGSNDVANLFPEMLYAHPGYKVKDKLENRLRTMVCAGRISLSSARRGIAADWEALYTKVYGKAPS